MDKRRVRKVSASSIGVLQVAVQVLLLARIPTAPCSVRSATTALRPWASSPRLCAAVMYSRDREQVLPKAIHIRMIEGMNGLHRAFDKRGLTMSERGNLICRARTWLLRDVYWMSVGEKQTLKDNSIKRIILTFERT